MGIQEFLFGRAGDQNRACKIAMTCVMIVSLLSAVAGFIIVLATGGVFADTPTLANGLDDQNAVAAQTVGRTVGGSLIAAGGGLALVSGFCHFRQNKEMNLRDLFTFGLLCALFGLLCCGALLAANMDPKGMLTACLVFAGSAGLFGALRLGFELDCCPWSEHNERQHRIDDMNRDEKLIRAEIAEIGNTDHERTFQLLADQRKLEAEAERMGLDEKTIEIDARRRLTSHPRQRYTSPALLQRLLRASTTDALLKSE